MVVRRLGGNTSQYRGEEGGAGYIQLSVHSAVACRFTPRTLVIKAVQAQSILTQTPPIVTLLDRCVVHWDSQAGIEANQSVQGIRQGGVRGGRQSTEA